MPRSGFFWLSVACSPLRLQCQLTLGQDVQTHPQPQVLTAEPHQHQDGTQCAFPHLKLTEQHRQAVPPRRTASLSSSPQPPRAAGSPLRSLRGSCQQDGSSMAALPPSHSPRPISRSCFRWVSSERLRPYATHLSTHPVLTGFEKQAAKCQDEHIAPSASTAESGRSRRASPWGARCRLPACTWPRSPSSPPPPHLLCSLGSHFDRQEEICSHF